MIKLGDWRWEATVQYRTAIRDSFGGIGVGLIDGPTFRASLKHDKSMESLVDDKITLVDTYVLTAWDVPELVGTESLRIDGLNYDIISIRREKHEGVMYLTVVRHG